MQIITQCACPALNTRKNKTANDTKLLKSSKGIHDGEWNFCRGKEPDIALFMQVG